MSEVSTYDVWRSISERADGDGVDALTEQESALHTCFNFVCQFDNGGLSGYGYNVDTRERDVLVASLRRINADLCAALMERANAIFNTNVPRELAKTWGEFLAIADPSNELDGIHDALSEAIDADDVRGKADELAAALANSH